jgi:signal transduction histidine kinase
MITTSRSGFDRQGRLTPGARRMISTYIASEMDRRRFGESLRETGEPVRQARRSAGVEQLAGGIGHHLNNILTAVIGYGSLVQQKMEADDPLKRYVEYMLSSSEMAAELTKKLLAYSGQRRVNPSAADLNDIVRGARRLLPLFANKSIELRMKLSGKKLPVFIDVPSFEEVLVNLISNAVDAMPQGGALTVATDSRWKKPGLGSRSGPSAGYALFAIADTGMGMAKETKRHAFDPFFTTKEVGRGMGLGLSVVHGVVKRHGGSIDLESKLGKGTKISVLLPIAK